MISLAFCSPFNNNNYPPSPLYSPPPAPPIPHNSPANNGEPDFPSPFDFPPPPPPITSQDINGGNKDYEWDDNLVLAGIAVLCFAFLIAVSIYYLYVYWRSNRQRLRQEERRRLRRLRISRNRGFSRRVAEDWFLASPREGLRRAMVDALPVFVYKPENFTDVLRCAVCLCEFQENEKAKLLPSCNHSFHVDCIDMWFYSHSTCPLCRARVDPQAVEMEISVREEEEEEEADDKVLMSSSEAAEQHIQGVDKNNGDSWEEEGSGEHDAIDIPTTEAAEQHIQSVNKNDGDSCEDEEGSGEHAAIDMPTTEN